MAAAVGEIARRISSRITHRIASLPILALNVHTACNCRCVMCDIWMANAQNRELTVEELDAHLVAMRRLRVQRVMLTGGEPLLHRNLWRLCERLQAARIRVTLVTTGLLIEKHREEIATNIDELVVSLDGAPEVHDAIRRVRNGFDRIDHGLQLLTNYTHRPRTIARSVIQHQNCARVVETIQAIRALPVDRLSFLAADVSSTAFNRPEPWSAARQAEVALSPHQLPLLAAAIDEVEVRCREEIDTGFVVGGVASLRRIHAYYSAVCGEGGFPPTQCNAPWVSAVVEPGGVLRPCFFHQPYRAGGHGDIAESLNAPTAVAFRRSLNVETNETCRRCVCTIALSPWTEV